eukprot:4290650-Amphidinium_carterae.1
MSEAKHRTHWHALACPERMHCDEFAILVQESSRLPTRPGELDVSQLASAAESGGGEAMCLAAGVAGVFCGGVWEGGIVSRLLAAARLRAGRC